MYFAAAPLALGILLGGMGLFTFVIAPAAHRALSREGAAAFSAALFPQYYLFAAAASVLACVGLVGREPYMAMLMLGVAAAALACRQVLTPMIERARIARESDAAAERRFARLHGVSRVLNYAMMVCAVAAAFIHA